MDIYGQDLALNNPQWLICHKTQPNPNLPYTNSLPLPCGGVLNMYIYLMDIYGQDLALNNPQWLICHKTQPNPNLPYTNSLPLSCGIYVF